MKAAAVAVFLLSIANAANAQQWNWTEHTYPEDGFRAEFNAPVKIERMRLKGDGADRVVRGTKYMLDEGERLYIVAASLNKDEVNFEKGAHEGFAGLQCGMTLSDKSFDAPWGTGRELSGRHCFDGSYRAEARYHRSGRWFYQVIALYKEADGDAASARYFLQSFRVTR
jgi:hypothetical protein